MAKDTDSFVLSSEGTPPLKEGLPTFAHIPPTPLKSSFTTTNASDTSDPPPVYQAHKPCSPLHTSSTFESTHERPQTSHSTSSSAGISSLPSLTNDDTAPSSPESPCSQTARSRSYDSEATSRNSKRISIAYARGGEEDRFSWHQSTVPLPKRSSSLPPVSLAASGPRCPSHDSCIAAGIVEENEGYGSTPLPWGRRYYEPAGQYSRDILEFQNAALVASYASELVEPVPISGRPRPSSAHFSIKSFGHSRTASKPYGSPGPSAGAAARPSTSHGPSGHVQGQRQKSFLSRNFSTLDLSKDLEKEVGVGPGDGPWARLEAEEIRAAAGKERQVLKKKSFRALGGGWGRLWRRHGSKG